MIPNNLSPAMTPAASHTTGSFSPAPAASIWRRLPSQGTILRMPSVRLPDGTTKPVASLDPVWARQLPRSSLVDLAERVSTATTADGMRKSVEGLCAFPSVGPVTKYTRRALESLSSRELLDVIQRVSRSHLAPLKVLRIARTSAFIAESTVREALWIEYGKFKREEPDELCRIERHLGVREGAHHAYLDLVYIVVAARKSEWREDIDDKERSGNDDPERSYWTPKWVTKIQLRNLIASHLPAGMSTIAEFNPDLAAKMLVTPGVLSALMNSSMDVVMGCGAPRRGGSPIIGKPEGPWMRSIHQVTSNLGIARANTRAGGSSSSDAEREIAVIKTALKRALRVVDEHDRQFADDEPVPTPGVTGKDRWLDRLRDFPRPVALKRDELYRRRMCREAARLEADPLIYELMADTI